MTRSVELIQRAKVAAGIHDPVVVDLHPDRPDYRGFQGPNTIVSLEADPTFAEIEQAGGVVHKDNAPHLVLGGMFLASGEVPRVTAYELGLQRGMRFDERSGTWEEDRLISDERYLACKIKGGGGFSRDATND
jgi:7,8-dihydropterin-6-yl-methyl-4-(beta-D-ribofuranosyl)aminobenzene 5'-phosphate synthase